MEPYSTAHSFLLLIALADATALSGLDTLEVTTPRMVAIMYQENTNRIVIIGDDDGKREIPTFASDIVTPSNLALLLMDDEGNLSTYVGAPGLNPLIGADIFTAACQLPSSYGNDTGFAQEGDVWMVDSISTEAGFPSGSYDRPILRYRNPVLANPRTTKTVTSSSLANNAEDVTSVVTMHLSDTILKVTVDRGCRVRLFANAASRTADTSTFAYDPSGNRPFEYPAVDGAGVYMDVQFSAAGSLILSPQVHVSDMEASPTGDYSVAIQNLSGATSTVQVDFLVIRKE